MLPMSPGKFCNSFCRITSKRVRASAVPFSAPAGRSRAPRCCCDSCCCMWRGGWRWDKGAGGWGGGGVGGGGSGDDVGGECGGGGLAGGGGGGGGWVCLGEENDGAPAGGN